MPKLNLTRSETESKAYGLELYRAQIESICPLEELLMAVHEQKVDVLRLKVNAKEKRVYSFLDALGIPFQLYNLLYANVVRINELDERMFQLPSGYEAEPCSAVNELRLNTLVANTIDRKTWVNYEAELVKDQITDEQELIASAAFARLHAYNEEGKIGWIILFNGEDVGFVTGVANGTEFNGTLCGIVPKHRNLDHSKVVYTISYKHCIEMGYNTFRNHIGVMNIPSQRSATGQYMVPSEVYFHFELYPLSSLNAEIFKQFEYSESFNLQQIVKTDWKTEIGTRTLRSINVSSEFNQPQGVYAKSNIAVNNDFCLLIIVRIYGVENKLIATQYMNFK
jgi:hypothetical protein